MQVASELIVVRPYMSCTKHDGILDTFPGRRKKWRTRLASKDKCPPRELVKARFWEYISSSSSSRSIKCPHSPFTTATNRVIGYSTARLCTPRTFQRPGAETIWFRDGVRAFRLPSEAANSGGLPLPSVYLFSEGRKGARRFFCSNWN